MNATRRILFADPIAFNPADCAVAAKIRAVQEKSELGQLYNYATRPRYLVSQLGARRKQDKLNLSVRTFEGDDFSGRVRRSEICDQERRGDRSGEKFTTRVA